MGILVALVLLPRIFGLRSLISYRVFVLDPYLVDVFLYLNSTWLLNLWICDHLKRNAFVHFVRM